MEVKQKRNRRVFQKRPTREGVTGVGRFRNRLWRAQIQLAGKKPMATYHHKYKDAVLSRLKLEIEHVGFDPERSSAYHYLMKNHPMLVVQVINETVKGS